MQITLTPEQQEAFFSGESITLSPYNPKWPFTTPTSDSYYHLKEGYYTQRVEDHKDNNVFKHEHTVKEIKHKLRFTLMCARFREYFEPDWKEVWDGSTINYSVSFHPDKKAYGCDWNTYVNHVGTIHMSKECANSLVNLLNRNQVPGFEL